MQRYTLFSIPPNVLRKKFQFYVIFMLLLIFVNSETLIYLIILYKRAKTPQPSASPPSMGSERRIGVPERRHIVQTSQRKSAGYGGWKYDLMMVPGLGTDVSTAGNGRFQRRERMVERRFGVRWWGFQMQDRNFFVGVLPSRQKGCGGVHAYPTASSPTPSMQSITHGVAFQAHT